MEQKQLYLDIEAILHDFSLDINQLAIRTEIMLTQIYRVKRTKKASFKTASTIFNSLGLTQEQCHKYIKFN